MTTDLTIRAYRTTDLDPVIRVWRAATVLAHPFLGPADLDQDEDLIRHQLIAKTETWLACHDETMLGFVSLMERTIVALFVDPAKHRSGIGARLLAHVNRLHGPLNVEVFADNGIAMPFYRKHGFTFQRIATNPVYPDQTQWIMAQPGAPIP